MKKLKILFVTSELFPFVKTGGLADVSASLPQILSELGHEVRIVVPRYGAIDSRKFKIHDVVRLKDLKVDMGSRAVEFSVKSSFLSTPKARVQIYFIDNEIYYGSRKSLYNDPLKGVPYYDNDERFSFFAKSVFELMGKLGWVPDVLHANDWQCGLVPALLKTIYKNNPLYSKFRILYTVHNFAEQGIFERESFARMGLDETLNSEDGILHAGKINILKAGIKFADVVNTVSSRYREEVLADDKLNGGLTEVIASRKNDFYGLINGIDSTIWNPEKDKFIPKKFNIKTIQNRAVSKQTLADRFGLQYSSDIPIIGMISRLYDYKGMDLLEQSFEELMQLNLQIVLLGTGDRRFHSAFEKLTKKNPNKFACYLGFSDELAHLIEAGSDMFLIPSKYEPCGLNQMYSSIYGSVPIVRETGGLADTVVRFTEDSPHSTGFMFKDYTPEAMISEIKRAIETYKDQSVWQKIMRNGMKCDFSWLSSAKHYVELYKKVLHS